MAAAMLTRRAAAAVRPFVRACAHARLPSSQRVGAQERAIAPQPPPPLLPPQAVPQPLPVKTTGRSSFRGSRGNKAYLRRLAACARRRNAAREAAGAQESREQGHAAGGAAPRGGVRASRAARSADAAAGPDVRERGRATVRRSRFAPAAEEEEEDEDEDADGDGDDGVDDGSESDDEPAADYDGGLSGDDDGYLDGGRAGGRGGGGGAASSSRGPARITTTTKRRREDSPGFSDGSVADGSAGSGRGGARGGAGGGAGSAHAPALRSWSVIAGSSDTRSLAALQSAAAADDVTAMRVLAEFYRSVEENQSARRHWLANAARAGAVMDVFEYGFFLYYATEEHDEGVRLIKACAARGYAEAELELESQRGGPAAS
jgi:hypothetical protein